MSRKDKTQALIFQGTRPCLYTESDSFGVWQYAVNEHGNIRALSFVPWKNRDIAKPFSEIKPFPTI